MKKLLLASAALFALGASASAADLPARAPAMAPAPVFTAMNWSGFYIGAQAGYLWSDNTLTFPFAGGIFGGPSVSNPDPNTFSLGGQIGYRHQYANGVVVGIEADLTWLNGSRGVQNYALIGLGIPSNAAGVNEHNWDASIRAQLGYSMGRWLPYITGGVSFLNEEGCAALINTAAPCFVGRTGFSSTRTGWTAGVGVAFAITNNLIAHAEYRYADYGSKSYFTPGLPVGRTVSDLQTSKAVVGLSWKFGGAASPVMARY